MVNAEKHKRKNSLEEKLQDLDINVIDVLNNNPEGVIKELTVNNAEIKRIYNKMLANEGSVLASNECRKLINYIFRTDYSLETIQLNYNAVKLDSSVIEDVINLCYEALDIFQKIQQLQQANLNDVFLDNIVAVDMANNPERPVEYYSSEEYLNLINLNVTYKTDKIH